MNKENNSSSARYSQTGIVILITVLGTLAIVASMTPLYLGNIEGWTPDRPQFFVQYCGMFINSISLATVATTLVFQHRQMKLQSEQLDQLNQSNDHNFKMAEDTYDSLILNLIKELQSESTEDTRKRASCFREYLKTSQDKSALESIFHHVITDSWGTSEEYQRILQTDFYKQFHSFTTLARYFDTLSYYEFNAMTANALHFYYIWWREAFLIYNEEYHKVYAKTENRHFSFIPNWISMTDRMDSQMEKHGLKLK